MKKYFIIYADPPWSYDDKMKGHSFSLDHEEGWDVFGNEVEGSIKLEKENV
jgi:N6-adenosine-specific RNA methylase IME4